MKCSSLQEWTFLLSDYAQLLHPLPSTQAGTAPCESLLPGTGSKSGSWSTRWQDLGDRLTLIGGNWSAKSDMVKRAISLNGSQIWEKLHHGVIGPATFLSFSLSSIANKTKLFRKSKILRTRSLLRANSAGLILREGSNSGQSWGVKLAYAPDILLGKNDVRQFYSSEFGVEMFARITPACTEEERGDWDRGVVLTSSHWCEGLSVIQGVNNTWPLVWQTTQHSDTDDTRRHAVRRRDLTSSSSAGHAAVAGRPFPEVFHQIRDWELLLAAYTRILEAWGGGKPREREF